MIPSVVAFDWETTGVEPCESRGVQFAALHFPPMAEGEVAFNTLCNPGIPIPRGASDVHNILDVMVQEEERDEVVARNFLKWLAGLNDPIITGHNVKWFDIPLTDSIAGDWDEAPAASTYRVIDTFQLAQRVYPLAPSHRLSDMCNWLKIGDTENAHDALADVWMVAELIKHFALKLDKGLNELVEWLDQPYIHKVCHFGKHKGKPWGRSQGCVPYHYVKWCFDNWNDLSEDMQITFSWYYGLSK